MDVRQFFAQILLNNRQWPHHRLFYPKPMIGLKEPLRNLIYQVWNLLADGFIHRRIIPILIVKVP